MASRILFKLRFQSILECLPNFKATFLAIKNPQIKGLLCRPLKWSPIIGFPTGGFPEFHLACYELYKHEFKNL